MSPVCQWHVLVCHGYATRMYLYVNRMSLVCTHMSSVFPSHVLICHPYITVCTHMSSVYHSYVLVCQSYVLVCHPYVTRMWFYLLPLTFFTTMV